MWALLSGSFVTVGSHGLGGFAVIILDAPLPLCQLLLCKALALVNEIQRDRAARVARPLVQEVWMPV